MRSIVSVFAVAAAMCAGASVGTAQQQTPGLEAGARVRLVTSRLPKNERVVRIVAAGGDTVAFRSERSSTTRSLPLSDIEGVEVSTGVRRRVARNAGMGLMFGAGVGGVLGYVTYEPCESFCLGPTTQSESAFFLGAVGGVLGLAVGTAIGAMKKTEQWQRVESGVRVSARPTRGGAAVSIAHAF